ncbi:hypothetical protein EYC59_01955 [Candidatus Saccharibacteria bacterium]|nr:MAG: hypothetical protein EYC59_01955 [Candidatus Saccharibacteria bacterium]
MKSYIFGIFAHPDDAAFGPGGTLALAARDGSDVHLICATCGGAGVNDAAYENLADVREAEERRAAEIMGATSCEMLRYDDGQLCNETYLEIAEHVMAHIRKTVTDPASEITLITFDPNGLTGHIDHIVMSQVATYVYLKLRDEYEIQLKYFCLPLVFSPAADTSWIYMPKGRAENEIDEAIDVRELRDQKIAAINAHVTQAKDGQALLARGEALFDEHFMYFE